MESNGQTVGMAKPRSAGDAIMLSLPSFKFEIFQTKTFFKETHFNVCGKRMCVLMFAYVNVVYVSAWM